MLDFIKEFNVFGENVLEMTKKIPSNLEVV